MRLWNWFNRQVLGHGRKAEHGPVQIKARAWAEAINLGLPTSVANQVMVQTDDPQEMAEVLRGLCAIRSDVSDEKKLWLVARVQETYPTLRRLATAKERSAEWLEHFASVMRIVVEQFPKVASETEEMKSLLDSILADGGQSQNQDLTWSPNPGCFERHLQRKHNNPLFPELERRVTQEQIILARERDQADALQLVEDVKGVQLEITSSSSFAFDQNPIRQRIDDLLERAAQVGGDVSSAMAKTLDDTRESVMKVWRARVAGNDKALQVLERAEAYQHSRTQVLHNPFIAQKLRKDTPITPEDVVPALLCESPETIRIFMQIMNDDARARVRQGADELVRRVQEEGAHVPLLEEKLKALKL